MKQYGLTLNLPKSLFIVEKITYLGYELSLNTITPSTTKVEAVLNFPCSKNEAYPWKWSDEHTKIVNILKNKICAKPILAIFDPTLPMTVYTDASRDGFERILTQKYGNKDKTIAFFSKQTTECEKNYHSFELELLVIIKTEEKFKYYLIGHEFTMITDCNAVHNAMNKQTIIPRRLLVE